MNEGHKIAVEARDVGSATSFGMEEITTGQDRIIIRLSPGDVLDSSGMNFSLPLDIAEQLANQILTSIVDRRKQKGH